MDIKLFWDAQNKRIIVQDWQYGFAKHIGHVYYRRNAGDMVFYAGACGLDLGELVDVASLMAELEWRFDLIEELWGH